MAKRFIIFTFLGFLFFNCAPGHTEEADPSPALVVYVTNSGTKYHVDGCSSLRRSRIPVSLADAVRSGYGSCSICKPPRLSGADSAAVENGSTGGADGGTLYRVNLAEPSRCEDVDFSRLVRAEVVDHVDGDTIRVRIPNPPDGLGVVETIRLIGVDTPETVHPRREVEFFGEEASNYTKSRLLGKMVYLAFDWDLRDRYGRLLAYVYGEDKVCHNAEIIRQGYGHAYVSYSFRFMDEFRNYEREARNAGRGLWTEH
ncbi:MAG: thermonuclease family protein [Treponema sp.]|jgi:micrococcal nuclease|nr:thermonuclease family protein [Treponema sp.]